MKEELRNGICLLLEIVRDWCGEGICRVQGSHLWTATVWYPDVHCERCYITPERAEHD